MHPPFGFALFYLRSVAPPKVKTMEIYWGAVPFVLIQVLMVGLIIAFPGLVHYQGEPAGGAAVEQAAPELNLQEIQKSEGADGGQSAAPAPAKGAPDDLMKALGAAGGK